MKLNAFSVTNLAVSVGMSVEFAAHVVYAFLRSGSEHETRNDRMVAALREMLQPMLIGACTSIISVICLIFARYPFYRSVIFLPGLNEISLDNTSST